MWSPKRGNVRDVHAIDGAVECYRRGRRNPISCRYDAIYASHHFEVRNVEYRCDEAIEAASDHGLIVAELELH